MDLVILGYDHSSLYLHHSLEIPNAEMWHNVLLQVRGVHCLTEQVKGSLLLGPLYMSPVNRAGSVSEISPREFFLCKIYIDVFIQEAGLARYTKSRFL